MQTDLMDDQVPLDQLVSFYLRKLTKYFCHSCDLSFTGERGFTGEKGDIGQPGLPGKAL